MIFLVLIIHIVFFNFYYLKLKNEVKTFKICTILLIFSFIFQSLLALECDVYFKTDEFILYADGIIN